MEAGIDKLRKIFIPDNNFPAPGSAEEGRLFTSMQVQLREQFEKVFPDKQAPRTVVVLPSYSLDTDILSKVKGALYYEERMLCLLMLLRMPLTEVIFITSMPVAESIVDYYLHMLPGITGRHARERLRLLSCYDASVRPLTQKVLERPRLMQRIRNLIRDKNAAHLTCFNITTLEKTMSVQLGIPLFGTDPAKFYEGSKSGGRKNFRAAGVFFPAGFEDLHTKEEVVKSLAALKQEDGSLRKAVIKMNDGFSGDGNAIYTYPAIDDDTSIEKKIDESFSEHFRTVAKDVSETLFFEKFEEMGGIVEVFLEGAVKMSPSVQCVIDPSGKAEVVSTHDQILGGDDGQVFIGAVFPADNAYNISVATEGKKVAEVLGQKGAMGRFAIDFISVNQDDGSWKHYAIEINLRKGGTTHPFLMLQFLTDGKYNPETGEYLTAGGNERFYFASDNVSSEKYKGLTPDDLLNISIYHNLIYDSAAQEGVMFHLVGALSEFGKFGLLCIGNSPERAKAYYDKTIEILDFECS
ncbi:MAG: peptide ligase PGM1-related protein [Ferruginibacter sp.]